MFTHHQLSVYQKAMAISANAEAFSAPWGGRHAMVDPFCRASESIVINIAEGARLTSAPGFEGPLDKVSDKGTTSEILQMSKLQRRPTEACRPSARTRRDF